jgi:hypothetical protein
MARCAGHKPDGTPCERIVGVSQEFCYAHDPDRAQARSEAASKAARSKVDVEISTIKRRLKEVAEGVLDGSIDKGRGSVAFQGYGVLIRAVEVERKVLETEQLVQEVEELKKLMNTSGAGGYRWGG